MEDQQPLRKIKITRDDPDFGAADWMTRYLESKRKPIWQRTISIDGHEVVLTNYNQEFTFTEIHEQELTDFVHRAREIRPELIEQLHELIFDDSQQPSRYNDEEKYPFNGYSFSNRIILYKRGQRTDIAHRTGVASNFIGTVAHDSFHALNREYEAAWKKAFGWYQCSEYPEDWEKVDGYANTTFRNRHTGWLAFEGQFTEHPELCVTDYARLAWDDDFADSGVVTLFNPAQLASICGPKVEMIEKKQFTT